MAPPRDIPPTDRRAAHLAEPTTYGGSVAFLLFFAALGVALALVLTTQGVLQ